MFKTKKKLNRSFRGRSSHRHSANHARQRMFESSGSTGNLQRAYGILDDIEFDYADALPADTRNALTNLKIALNDTSAEFMEIQRNLGIVNDQSHRDIVDKLNNIIKDFDIERMSDMWKALQLVIRAIGRYHSDIGDACGDIQISTRL